jgi:hypothetical protein
MNQTIDHYFILFYFIFSAGIYIYIYIYIYIGQVHQCLYQSINQSMKPINYVCRIPMTMMREREVTRICERES